MQLMGSCNHCRGERWPNFLIRLNKSFFLSILMFLMLATVLWCLLCGCSGEDRHCGPLRYGSLGCFHPPGPSIILEKIILYRRDRATACLSTISLHCTHCVLGAGGDFTALGLLAISFCIDSLLKAIDFHPAA